MNGLLSVEQQFRFFFAKFVEIFDLNQLTLILNIVPFQFVIVQLGITIELWIKFSKIKYSYDLIVNIINESTNHFTCVIYMQMT